MSNTNFYRAFEDRHRGPRALIMDRLAVYRPFIEPLKTIHVPCNVIDLGCGRGEWLELTQAWGLQSCGVDLDDFMLAACRERGLSVETVDAGAALAGLADASQSVVSGFHIAEHLLFDDLQTIMANALRVLKPGGLLILETPNPENIIVASTNFYMDPTHTQKLPQELLSFLATHSGFARVKILRLNEPKNLATAPRIGLIDVLGGASPDYALIAQKSATFENMQKFDAAFAQSYGLALHDLASRHEAGIAEQFAAFEITLGEAHALVALVQAETVAARTEAALASRIAAKTQAQTDLLAFDVAEARRRAVDAQALTQSAQAQLRAVYESRSWRFSWPLRAATIPARHVKAKLRAAEWGAKKFLRRVVRRVAGQVRAHPKSLHIAKSMFARLPVVERRLKRLTALNPADTASPTIPKELADLTPHARAICAKLQIATQPLEIA